MKEMWESAREKGKTEQESKEERGKFLSIPGSHDCIAFLLPRNRLTQTLLLKITYISYLIISVGEKSRHNLAGVSALGFYQAAIQALARALVSS